MKISSWSARRSLASAALLATLVGAGAAAAQSPRVPAQPSIQPRIRTAIQDSVRAAIPGSRPPRALAANDAGPVPASMKIVGASIVFNRSDAQQAALDALLAAQQDPASPAFHQWLTPDDFAARFGMSDSDLAKVRSWLESQGLTVESVSRGRDRLTFTGTAAQVAQAFQADLHFFKSGAETHFAPSGDLTIPAALAGSVQAVTNLSDFRPRPHVRTGAATRFTSSQSGSHFLTPSDVATIYDITAAYNAGYTGTGQSIAIVGQSAIIPSDITAFQTAAGLPLAAPTIVLQPGTGVSTLYSGDQSESDLDIEYAGGIARGAQIYFVYTGSSVNYGVFDAMIYAVANRIAPVISVSYGECETALGQSSYNSYLAIFQQAAAQGQTIVASSGDDGSTDCYQFTSLLSSQRTALAVDFPADSPYVTGLGGTEFLSSAVATGTTQYFAAANGSDTLSSALSYIPEQTWNDDSSSNGLSSGGGGVSAFAARPTWQSSSVPGISAISGANRLVPDVSLASSSMNAGYLYCSSDSGATGIEGSCTHGFRDANTALLTVAGGTSFAAPIFAGMIAIINQATRSTGQGLVNPTLYSLASSATTYASAFHDITLGGNQCTAGSTFCTTAGAAAYAASTGYDQATGLGSVDFFRLLSVWPTTSGTATASSLTTLTAATTAPKLSTADTVTITVARSSGTGTAVPTGTVALSINGAAPVTLTLVNGVATYSFSSATAGQAVLVATYSGDANYAPSSATLLLQVGSTGTFTLSASSPTVTAGGTTTSTVTVTPINGYTGTVALTATASPVIANACYTVSNATVGGTAPATATITIITNLASCNSTTTTLQKYGVLQAFTRASGTASLQPPLRPARPSPVPLGLSLAGLCAIGMIGRRSRTLRGAVFLSLLALAGFGISGCGSGSIATNPISSTPATSYTPTGSYTVVVSGADTTNSATNAFASFTLKVQ